MVQAVLSTPGMTELKATHALVCAIAVVLAAPQALAQGAPTLSPPPDAPESARAPNGEYVAPMQQTTQPSYVPQSVGLSGPRALAYADGDHIPLGYHLESRRRSALLGSGAAVLGALWLVSVLSASLSADLTRGRESNPLAGLYAPVLGPFIALGDNTNGSALGSTVLVLNGLGQTAGAAMLVAGLFLPKKVLVRNDLAQIQFAPTVGPHGSGLSLRATF